MPDQSKNQLEFPPPRPIRIVLTIVRKSRQRGRQGGAEKNDGADQVEPEQENGKSGKCSEDHLVIGVADIGDEPASVDQACADWSVSQRSVVHELSTILRSEQTVYSQNTK